MAQFQHWQAAIGPLLGLIGLLVGAFLGFRFSLRRDAHLREQEARSIAAAIYAEMVTLREYAAKMANLVAARYEEHGLRGRREEPFDAHFFEMVPMPAAPIYAGLSSQIGKLPADVLLGVVQFHASYEEARYWLPRLEENEDRGFSYGVLYVLHPALQAAEEIQPTLRAIERLADISPATDLPDLKRAKRVAAWEEESWAEIMEANAD